MSDGDIDRECDALSRSVMVQCRMRGVRIAVSESLTGGLLADAFVRVPGASTVFLGSAVTYDVRAKASILGVNRDVLRDRGAVDPTVAAQMASAVARLFDQPVYGGRVLGLSTTGVAGPGPDGRGMPEGLVYVGVSMSGVSDDAGVHVMRVTAHGDRGRIRRYAVDAALRYVSHVTSSDWE
ncbi:CinA family protein [uncultured Bifidobacterium sp.]|uniref:CinA family protein n=1 Tax=uncultured Bifidobacterium sp. TaxID=165187 RepID=UPI0026173EC6|nr:CinA family protein [uncultured Bifidobacterium sp.]